MSRGHKTWLAAGLLGALLARQRQQAQALRLRAADGTTLRGLEAAPVEAPPSLLAPETAEQIEAEVRQSLVAWRDAVLAKDAETVIRLDRAFVSAPARYRAALEVSARTDTDARVRAFSTRVLGKEKRAALAPLFAALLADKSPFVRQNAAWALGELAAQEDGRVAARHAAAELRHARSKDPAPDVRTAAQGALARLE
jgi:HEAT repeat protein